MSNSKDKVIIANMSGFYGDRLSAAREMVEGGSIDFLTGDYLAELTMAILYRAQAKKPELGYARTFLKQMEEVMGSCLDKNIKVVANAGGLNPQGLAIALTKLSDNLQINPKIAWIDGDDLMPRLTDLQKQGVLFQHLDHGYTLKDSKMLPVTANAYLGCWGVVEALNQGADIVVTGRIADTSLVMGPAAYYFGWDQDNWDALAGAAVAGHIIECGGQATGGNYSFFEEVPDFNKLGFPIAEVYRDGSTAITKHSGTGGRVNVGTLTAQLLYEINRPEYITPDVVAHFDTINLKQKAADRVEVSGVKGSPATDTAKVTLNCVAGFQNSMTLYLTGLELEKKVEIFRQTFIKSVGGDSAFDHLDFQFFPTHKETPPTNEEAFAQLRVSVIDKNPAKAGKRFTSKLVELALCTVPGLSFAHAPDIAKPRVVHFPALIDKQHLRQYVHVNEKTIEVEEVKAPNDKQAVRKGHVVYDFSFTNEPSVPVRLGKLYAARSGDKGGNANLGVWAKTPKAYAFLSEYLTVEKLEELLPDIASFDIQRYDFPNLLGMNFYIRGFLGDGVAASFKMDPQAKTLGEYLRMKMIAVPASLVGGLSNSKEP